MKKPLLTKENVLLMFTLGIEVLKSMKVLYETKTEGKLKDDNTTTHTTGDSKENSNLSDSSINNR
jgi:hypothetical protein